ncbi:parasitic phase-specific protein psp-1 [Phialemonium atrogriseum]|uniref:Parasitic phase-specific protein psp-1 n=1 Tax=Phialemonium atrogriseum TaxID=1093897 RepID=A0AAJ0BYD1_9PEZI|nr:parasitic phase-specific protein psp-1 [Phialemonium atrogriseum]KAK1764346.1 parasitic phase-specific protein psp-1 [Phialemonium atrogriseum]
MSLPDGLISYGPDSNCTLELCPVEWSALQYRPSLAASGIFIGLFATTMIIHIVEGIRWQTWGFMACMILGCLDEIIGYVGRIVLHGNPFSFSGFFVNIFCIATAPLFFCAAIYVTLSKTIRCLDPSISRFNPKLLYWVFIPCDVVSLALQGAGGAISSVTSGSSKLGADIVLGGLSLQVFTILVFLIVAAEYFIRFLRAPGRRALNVEFKIYLTFLSLSILLILVRCVYRIDELSDGFLGPVFHNERLFYGLESIPITIAVFCLNLGHLGLGLREARKVAERAGGESGEKKSQDPGSVQSKANRE